MIKFLTGPLHPLAQARADAEKACPQILSERHSLNDAVMEARLSAYLLLADLTGGTLPAMGWSDKGAPYFLHGGYCSLSHTDTGAGAVIADVPVGMDVQTRFILTKARLQRVCVDAERFYCMQAADGTEQSLRLTRVWAAKEAVSKVLGTGIGKLSFAKIRTDCITGTAQAENRQFALLFPESGLPDTVCCVAWEIQR